MSGKILESTSSFASHILKNLPNLNCFLFSVFNNWDTSDSQVYFLLEDSGPWLENHFLVESIS